MSKGRIIISTTTDNEDKHEAIVQQFDLLGRQFSLHSDNRLRHAIGMFEGKEELSVVIDIPEVPFIVLAASAHNLCLRYKQKSVYFSHNGHAYLATFDGEMIRLGFEQEAEVDLAYAGKSSNHTRIIGTNYYIWTYK